MVMVYNMEKRNLTELASNFHQSSKPLNRNSVNTLTTSPLLGLLFQAKKLTTICKNRILIRFEKNRVKRQC